MNLHHCSNHSAFPEIATSLGGRHCPTCRSEAGRAVYRSKLEKILRLCRRNRRGAAIVEFAVVAPVLFLLVFGMIEYGRLVMVQQMLTNASREGARLGVLDGTTTTDIENTVDSYLTSAAVSGATVTVTPDPPSSAGYGEPVTVTVTVPFDQVSWLPSPIFLGGTTLTATTVMRRETTQ